MKIPSAISDVFGSCFPCSGMRVQESSQDGLTVNHIVHGFSGVSQIAPDFARKSVIALNKKILQRLEKNLGNPSINIGSVTVSERANYQGNTDIEVEVAEHVGIEENRSFKNLRLRLAFDQLAQPSLYGTTLREKYLLSHRDWSGTNLSGMHLERANLSRMTLSKVNLSVANLSVADLSEVNLSGANLNMANLSIAKLIEANLSGANLKGADLSLADLSGADLSGADLSGASLSIANLSGADLSGADLSGADLSGADLSVTCLSGVDLSGANLCGADLRGAKLRGHMADLRGVDLHAADLRGADLSEANLHQANLSGADLSGADLSGVNLTCVVLKCANLSRTKLADNILKEANITLNFPNRWIDREVDIFFNHIANQGRSLLMTIDGIDGVYEKVKINLMRQICFEVECKKINIELVHKNFFLLLKKPYLNDLNIAVFCEKRVIKPIINQANKHPWVNKEVDICSGLLNYVKASDFFDPIKNNGFFIQLILNSLNLHSPETIRNAQEIYETQYLSLDKLQQIIALDDFGYYGEYTINWSDDEANNFVLIDKDLVMMMSKSQLMVMLNKKIQKGIEARSWSHFFLFRFIEINGKNALREEEGPKNLGVFFKDHFKLFHEPYLHAKMVGNFLAHLNLIRLKEYHPYFVSALDAKSYPEKLTGMNHQKRLIKLFKKVLDFDESEGLVTCVNLKKEHYQNIQETFHLTDASNEKQAQLLFCLATVFVNYSSSAIFGTESDSPSAVRYYACALMSEAEAHYPGICPSTHHSNFEDRRNRLLGLKGVFTCTSILFEEMRASAQRQAPDVLGAVLPPAWR